MELRQVLRIKDFELFDFDYPISDQNWKEELESLFKDYFFFYEIGSETIDRFKHNLKTKLRTIMPYYNQLYETTLLDIDPLLTMKLKEIFEEKQDTEGYTSSTGSSNNTMNQTRTDYPQHSDIESDIPTEKGKTDESGTSTTSGSSEGSSLRDYEKIIEGYSSDPHSALAKYRENILNINHQIIRECKDLFILVY